jgi:hypothetical protein
MPPQGLGILAEPFLNQKLRDFLKDCPFSAVLML